LIHIVNLKFPLFIEIIQTIDGQNRNRTAPNNQNRTALFQIFLKIGCGCDYTKVRVRSLRKKTHRTKQPKSHRTIFFAPVTLLILHISGDFANVLHRCKLCLSLVTLNLLIDVHLELSVAGFLLFVLI